MDSTSASQKPLRASIYGDFIARLDELNGSPQRYAANALAIQCLLGRTRAGAVLKKADGGALTAVALYPPVKPNDPPLPWLDQARAIAAKAMAAGTTCEESLAESADQQQLSRLLAMPVSLTGGVAEVFLVPADDETRCARSRQMLEATALLLALSEKRLEHGADRASAGTLGKATHVLISINEHQRFRAAAMAFCNEMATQWGCERASLGFVRGRTIRLEAISHAEHFGRKMKLVQDIEAAMEECADQDSEIVLPAPPDATVISRTTSELAAQHGPMCVLSLPLRDEDNAAGVALLQRPSEKPFQSDEIEAMRLACDLCTPRLLILRRHDRWFGARAGAKARRALAVLVGAEHTWAKLATVAAFAFAVFLVFAKGPYRAEASFVLEATEQHALCAPFDGFLKGVYVEVGDVVEADQTILAELDTAELRLQLAAAKAEESGYLREIAAAMRDGETAQAQIAQANADKAQAQIALNEHFISQARLLAPADGTVVTGDLKRQIGAPVQFGDALFEIAPLELLRAELRVPEDEVFDIAIDQHGYLATVSYPSRRIEFVVERIDPAAEVIDGRNVFTVRARLLDVEPWMRPGMGGVAKVSVGQRRYAWIWSRKIVNWVRMKLWI